MANKLQILGKRVRFFFTSLNGARSVARNFLLHRAQDFFARIKQMSRDEEERCCFRDTFRQRKIFRALHFAERKPTGFFRRVRVTPRPSPLPTHAPYRPKIKFRGDLLHI